MNKRTLNGQFTDIYNAFAGIIFRFCILRVSNREQALDITQETFTRFWNELCHGKKILNPKAFLFTVAHRQVIDWYRKKKSVSLDGLADEETGEPYEPRNELAL